MFKKGAISWRNGVFLSATHLTEEREFIIRQISNIKHLFAFSANVFSLLINEIKLSKGVLEILSVNAMFPNMQYIEYDINDPTVILETGELSGNIYPIREDLNQFAKSIRGKGLMFYLAIDGTFPIRDLIEQESDTPVMIDKYLLKLKLIPEYLLTNQIAIPICRIIYNENGFVVDREYMAPNTNISKKEYLYEILTDFIKTLRVSLLETVGNFFTNNEREDVLINKLYLGLKYNSLMPNLLNLESALMTGDHPKEIFYILQNIIGSLSLLKFTQLPSASTYNHYDIFESINLLVNNILSMLSNIKEEGEKILFDKDEHLFSVDIPEEIFISGNAIYLLIEIENENDRDRAVYWIEEGKISGDNFQDQRIRGIGRKIKNTNLFGNNILLVELDLLTSRYINRESKKIIISNTLNNNYVPNNISLFWRVKKIV